MKGCVRIRLIVPIPLIKEEVCFDVILTKMHLYTFNRRNFFDGLKNRNNFLAFMHIAQALNLKKDI